MFTILQLLVFPFFCLVVIFSIVYSVIVSFVLLNTFLILLVFHC